MPPRRAVALALTLGVLARAAAAQAPEISVQLTDVSVQSQGDTVTVSIATSAAPKYRSELMDGPFRLVLDFEDTLYRWKTAPVPIGADPVREVRGSQYRKGVARLVVELQRRAAYTLEPHAGGLRVVFTPARTADSTPAPPPARPPAAAAKPTAPPAAPGWRLQGIVIRDETAVAYIADAANQTKRYAVGDPIGDGVVEAIEERHVVLKTPRGPVELRLEAPRPAPRP